MTTRNSPPVSQPQRQTLANSTYTTKRVSGPAAGAVVLPAQAAKPAPSPTPAPVPQPPPPVQEPVRNNPPVKAPPAKPNGVPTGDSQHDWKAAKQKFLNGPFAGPSVNREGQKTGYAVRLPVPSYNSSEKMVAYCFKPYLYPNFNPSIEGLTEVYWVHWDESISQENGETRWQRLGCPIKNLGASECAYCAQAQAFLESAKKKNIAKAKDAFSDKIAGQRLAAKPVLFLAGVAIKNPKNPQSWIDTGAIIELDFTQHEAKSKVRSQGQALMELLKNQDNCNLADLLNPYKGDYIKLVGEKTELRTKKDGTPVYDWTWKASCPRAPAALPSKDILDAYANNVPLVGDTGNMVTASPEKVEFFFAYHRWPKQGELDAEKNRNGSGGFERSTQQRNPPASYQEPAYDGSLTDDDIPF